ncbi:MAG TPA: diphthine--ammonia ligase, partial [Candidatus Omnitrophota bacterium]|nr:diphthine--ammonia ligase [Candidatus Omnitrophota bacterium]
KVVGLWSGGKDSFYACYLAREAGHNIITLLNFINTAGHASLSHGLDASVIALQAGRTGIPLVQKKSPGTGEYRKFFLDLICEWRESSGIEGVVFGDIYLQAHKDWISSVCRDAAVTPLFPLWGKETRELAGEMIEAGIKAIIVAIDSNHLGKEWLGRVIDDDFLNTLPGCIDICGEQGEFHTFVFDGPMFTNPVIFQKGKKVNRDGHWLMEIII